MRVGGADLAGLDLAEWRSRIAWVPQRPHLYAGTIAENVRLARPGADDGAVRRALRDAGAWEFVAALPDGVDTVLGEDGAGLSAGQRQRLALARAFLADRPVLLLDEPTAALDGATEADVVAAVRRLAAGRTVLLVVHRPALLEVADRVVRLGGAEVAKPPVDGRTPRRTNRRACCPVGRRVGRRAGRTGGGSVGTPRRPGLRGPGRTAVPVRGGGVCWHGFVRWAAGRGGGWPEPWCWEVWRWEVPSD